MSAGAGDAGTLRRAAAWGVHLLTASSAPAGLLALLATDRGEPGVALGWMAYTVAIDSIDGTLARAVGVKKVLPLIDGTRLDDVVDYVTYVIVPAYFLVRTGLLPPDVAALVACCPVLASAFGFTRTDAKTEDHFFTGFPSYWNVVAFYLYTLGWPLWLNAAIVLALSLAVFVPLRYVYPSRTPTLRGLTVTLGLAWGAVILWALWGVVQGAAVARGLVLASLAFPLYYFLLSLVLHRQRARA